MRKPDEIQFYRLIRNTPLPDANRIDATASGIGMNINRLYALLDKWCDKGWWQFGTSIHSGWFAPHAPQSLEP